MKNFSNDKNNLLLQHYNDLSHYPILSEEEKMDLLRKSKNGDVVAKTKLINCHLKFVWFIANTFNNIEGVNFEDLLSYGSLGLNKAVESFDFSYNVKFQTYAYYLIRGSIIENINKSQYIIKIPPSVRKNIKIIKDVLKKIGENSNVNDIYKYCLENNIKISKESIIASLFYPKYSFSTDEFSNCLENDIEDPIDYSNKTYLYETLNYSINNVLNEKEKYIIKNYYGLDQNNNLTLKEIGLNLNITKERVRQLRNLALEKIKKTNPDLERYL